MTESFQAFSNSLQHQTLSAEEILSSGQLHQALNTHFHPIFQSVAQTNILNKLLEWGFSTKFINDPKFNEYSNAAISIFCSAATNNPEFLKNKFLLSFLYNFFLSKDSENQRLTGHFSRLFMNNLDCLSYFIGQYNKLPSLLISRIESYGIQNLIVAFVKKGDDLYQYHTFIYELSCIANTSDAASLTLCSIYRALPKDSNPIRKEFFSHSLILQLADAAIATKSCFIQAELAYVISDLISIDPTLNDFTSDQISFLKLTKNNITTLSIECMDIFYHSNSELFQFFFLDERLHHKLIKMIQITSEKQLIEIAKIPDFVDTLIDSYGTDKWCSHCSKIAIEFGSLSLSCKELQTDRWLSFCKQHVDESIQILSSEYGGKTPQPASSTELALMKQLQMPFKFSPSVKMTMQIMSKRNDTYQSYQQDEEIEIDEEEDENEIGSFDSDEDSGEEYAIDL